MQSFCINFRVPTHSHGQRNETRQSKWWEAHGTNATTTTTRGWIIVFEWTQSNLHERTVLAQAQGTCSRLVNVCKSSTANSKRREKLWTKRKKNRCQTATWTFLFNFLHPLSQWIAPPPRVSDTRIRDSHILCNSFSSDGTTGVEQMSVSHAVCSLPMQFPPPSNSDFQLNWLACAFPYLFAPFIRQYTLSRVE